MTQKVFKMPADQTDWQAFCLWGYKKEKAEVKSAMIADYSGL